MARKFVPFGSLRIKCLFALIAGFCSASWASGTEPRIPEFILHVDALVGLDAPETVGTASQPYRTARYALDRARTLGSSVAGGALVELRIASLDRESELLPLRPFEGLSGLILRPVPETGRLRIDLDPTESLVDLPSGGQAREFFLALRRLELRGGIAGARTVAVASVPVRLEVEDCAFHSQRVCALRLQATEGAVGSMRVVGTSVFGAGDGIVTEAASGASIELAVEASRVEGIVASGPDGMLGSGVVAHVDPQSSVTVRIERCVFRECPSAALLTTSERYPDWSASSGRLRAEFLGNLVEGSLARGGAAPPGIQNGLYFSIEEHHDVGLLVASNTFVGLNGHALQADNLSPPGGEGFRLPLVFVNNLCSTSALSSEFVFERAGDPLPPEGSVIAHNLLTRSRLGEAATNGNISADPAFLDPTAGDFRLATESPAVDAGASPWAPELLLDLLGNCRRAGEDCRPGDGGRAIDLGAYELPGSCSEGRAGFVRGDCNDSGGVPDIADAIFSFVYLFLGSDDPRCSDACDSNDDGTLDITDGIATLGYLFSGGSAPPVPFPEAGVDASADCLKPCD